MNIEKARNILNLEIRELLSLMDLIQNETGNYPNYIENTMNEEEFLLQQTELIKEVRERLMNIIK